MAFDTQITDLVGGTIDQNACDQWLEDGVRELINVFPSKLKEMCYAKSTFTSAAVGSEAETIASQHLGSVYAGSVACRKIVASDKYKAADSGSVEFATSTDPVYYIEGGKLNILPASLSGIYYIVGAPSIDADSDSSISNFPDEAEYLVVLFASIKQLHQYMNLKSSDLPSDLAVPVLETVSESLPTWSAPDDFIAPTVPVSLVSASFSTPTIGAITVASTTLTNAGTAPLYAKPSLTARVAFSNYTSGLSETDPGIFSLTAVAPATPSAPSYTTPDVSSTTIASTTVSVIGAPPSYTAPVFTSASTYLTEMEAGTIGDAASDIDMEHWFSIVGQLIEDNEDIELASAQLNKISTFLNAFQADMQNQLNIFNKNNVAYQAKVQEGIQQAQINATKAQGQAQISATEAQQEASLLLQKEQQEYSATLQKYQAEVSIYQANVNKEVQGYGQKLQHYSTELNTAYQAWAKTESDSLQQYSVDIQNNLNDFNRANAEYQVKLQEAIQQAQLSSQRAQQQAQIDSTDAQQEASLKLQKEQQEYSSKLQKYQADISSYGAEVNTNAQTFTNAITKNRAAFDTSMQKYTSGVQKVSASNASTLQKFQAETADYSAKLQKLGMDYQWYQSQYMALKADYQQGLQQLVGGGGTPPPAQ